MAEPDLPVAPSLTATPAAWIDTVSADFDAFLSDHASCEKKASGMAMNMAAHYPDQPELLNAMVDLAVEELTHYREVIRIMLERGLTPGPDTKDDYINQLNKNVRKGPANFLLDRMLVAAVVERRGAERFALIAQRLIAQDTKDLQLAKFYQGIAASEERHWVLFYQLALSHCEAELVAPRFSELSDIESDIMLALPLRAALH